MLRRMTKEPNRARDLIHSAIDSAQMILLESEVLEQNPRATTREDLEKIMSHALRNAEYLAELRSLLAPNARATMEGSGDE